MGFGYLLLGYLITFVIYLTVQALNVGSLATLLGYALMCYGLFSLNRYDSAFTIAKWMAVARLCLVPYAVLTDASSLFLFDLPILGGVWEAAVRWIGFCVEIILLFAMLYGIRMLADSIELKKLSGAALRNTLFVGAYALLYLVWNLPFAEGIRPYLTFSVQLMNLAVIFVNVLLLLQCTKNICREGDEEVTPKRSRFEWINRMGDAYEKAHTKLNEQAKADGEAFMRQRVEKKKNKKKKR